MARTHLNETYDQEGNVVASEVVEVAERSIDDDQARVARQVLRSMVGEFYQNGQPTGTPTAAQIRNWCLALTAAVRYLSAEMDDEA